MPFMNAGTSTWLENVAPDAKEKILSAMVGLKSKAEDNDTIYKEGETMDKKTEEVTEDVQAEAVVETEETKEEAVNVADSVVEDSVEVEVVVEAISPELKQVFSEIALAMLKQEEKIDELNTKLETLTTDYEKLEETKEVAPLMSFQSIMNTHKAAKAAVATDDLAAELLKEAPAETEEELFDTPVSLLGL